MKIVLKKKTKKVTKVSKGSISRDQGHPRSVHVYSMDWMEVFASPDMQQVDKARAMMYSVPMSVYTLLDPTNSDRMVMTTQTFWSEARHLLVQNGMIPWGVSK